MINFVDVVVVCIELYNILLVVEKFNLFGYISDLIEMVEVGICDGEEIYFIIFGNIWILLL